jgi:hypothetical protein
LWDKFKAIVISRKFWACVASTIVLLNTAGLTPVQIATGLITIWSVYVAATAVEDGLARR